MVSYVKIYVKSLDIYRENIGYASCIAVMKGSAIHQARKVPVFVIMAIHRDVLGLLHPGQYSFTKEIVTIGRWKINIYK